MQTQPISKRQPIAPTIDEHRELATQAAAERARRSFSAFVRQSWPLVEPARPFIPNLASDAIIEHLQAIADGKIRSLLIAVSPGIGKSTLCSVLFPAWVWTHRPHWRAICASYAHTLAVRDSLKTRRLVEDDWYRQRFARDWTLRADQNRADDFENTKSGRRLAVGVGGALTGSRANHATVDDSLNAVDAYSKVIRDMTNDWFDQALSTRLDTEPAPTMLVIQQRLHETDLIGHLLERGGFETLILPSEFDSKRRCRTSIWVDPRQTDGELIAPAIHSAAFLAEQKRTLGSFGFAGQYQQTPAPQEGGLFKRAWFKFYEPSELPKLEDEVMSVDCAFKKTETGSRVSVMVIGRQGPHRYILANDTRPMTFIETVAAIRRMLEERPKVSKVLVEAKANGDAVIEVLRQTIQGVIEIEPEGGKESRAAAVQPIVEGGHVALPKGAPWAEDFLYEVCTFPAGKDDQVDAMSQALNYMRGTTDAMRAMMLCKI